MQSIDGDLERPPDKVLAFVASMPLLYGDDVAPATSYACPMHPEVTSTEPGTCPKCGMKLVPSDAPPAPHEDASTTGTNSTRNRATDSNGKT